MQKKSRMERLRSQSRYRLKVSQTLCSASRAAKPLIAHFWDLPQCSTWRASVVWWPMPCKPSGILVSEDGVELDLDQLTDSMSMAFPGRQQRFRFLERFRLHPPFLGARHQHRGVKNL